MSILNVSMSKKKVRRLGPGKGYFSFTSTFTFATKIGLSLYFLSSVDQLQVKKILSCS